MSYYNDILYLVHMHTITAKLEGMVMMQSKNFVSKAKTYWRSQINLQFFGSNMRCKVCNGWGGEFGDARGVGSMCKDCYYKKYGTYI